MNTSKKYWKIIARIARKRASTSWRPARRWRHRNGSASRTRTCDPVVNSHLLYQLSYRGSDCLTIPCLGNVAKPARAKNKKYARNYSIRLCVLLLVMGGSVAHSECSPDVSVGLTGIGIYEHDDKSSQIMAFPGFQYVGCPGWFVDIGRRGVGYEFSEFNGLILRNYVGMQNDYDQDDFADRLKLVLEASLEPGPGALNFFLYRQTHPTGRENWTEFSWRPLRRWFVTAEIGGRYEFGGLHNGSELKASLASGLPLPGGVFIRVSPTLYWADTPYRRLLELKEQQEFGVWKRNFGIFAFWSRERWRFAASASETSQQRSLGDDLEGDKKETRFFLSANFQLSENKGRRN